MKISQAIVLGTISLAASATLAAEPPSTAPDTTPKSRSQVRQDAIDARAKGQTNVGDDPLYPNSPAKPVAKPSKRKTKNARTTQPPANAPDYKK